MTTLNPFSCFIIGETTLLTQCAALILERGHAIRGIVSADQHVLRWSRRNGIPTMEPSGDLLAFLRQHPFDYLFSIVNPRRLPNEVLQLPDEKAINYHNAPLPRYAGRYATSWAILNQEMTHGITWHVMTEQLDAGDILKQVMVDIDPDETTFSLNMKCYSAALRGFGELVDELAANRAASRVQDLSQRTYFSTKKRPSPGCLVSWHWYADYLDCFVRALDFGRYPNPLGCPKMIIGNECLIIRKLEILPAAGDAPPGTVVAVTPDAIRIATESNDVSVGELLTQDGQPVQVSDLADRLGVVEGNCLEPLDEARMLILEAQNEAISRHETYWLRRLSSINPLRLPAGSSFQEKREETAIRMRTCSLSEVTAGLPQETWPWAKERVLLAAHLAFFFRLQKHPMGDVGLVSETFLNEVPGLELLFSPVVPLRVEWNPQQSFLDYVGSVSEACVRAQKRAPFFRDLTDRCPEIKSGQHKHLGEMFSITFVIGKRDFVKDVGDSVRPSDLTISLSDHGTEYHWQYDPGAAGADVVERMHQHFRTFLTHAIAEPDKTVAAIPILTDREYRQVLREWNATAKSYPHLESLTAQFETQASQRPDAIAVVSEQQQLTYQQLDRCANQLAYYLQRHGIGPEARVGLCLDRSSEMILAVLGVLKAGGAYVPMDPGYPQERLALMAKDAGLRLIVTQQKFQEYLAPSGVERICLDADWPVIGKQDGSSPVSGVTADSLAYVIFTSGSTGRPKAVEVEHRQVLNYVDGILDRLKVPAGSSFAMVSTLTADLGNTMLYPALATGGTLHVISEDRATDAVALGAYFQQHQPDCLKIVPSHLASLMMGPTPAEVLPQKCLVLGGEACPWSLVEKVQALRPGCRVINHYGPTETTVGVTTYPVETRDRATGQSPSVPIGRPLPNSQVCILDPYQYPVPPGFAGELYIGGRGLARGYAGAPELTGEKFVPYPYSENPGARLYRTGDRAKFRTDGTIEFLGRIDHQVKLRGFRVELGEIESVLNRHESVHAAVVVVQEKEGRRGQLVAYVVPGQEQPSPGELRQVLKQTLPEYMVPTVFVMLEDLPLTPNGKVDRRALPVPAETRPELDAEFQVPRPGPEQTLADIWRQLLRVDRVGRHDNFFELGGDSILSIQVGARAGQAGLRVTTKQIFQHQTIAELAKVVGVYQEITAPQGVLTGPLPLTPIQNWFFEQCFLDADHWNMAWVLEAPVPLLPAHMEQAVAALLVHHDALRLRAIRTDEGWQQELGAPDGSTPFAWFDWSHMSAAEAEKVWALEARRLQASLSLSDGPLIRVALAHFGSGQPDRVLLVIHHLAVDGVSLRILFEDLQTAYEKLQNGQPIRLRPKTTPFSQWAEGLLEYARSGALEQETSYWQEVVNSPRAPLPRDVTDDDNTVESTRTVVVELTREETQTLLQRVPETYHTQINDVLLTALVDTMTQWTHQENLPINLEGHGREYLLDGIDLSRTVGWFTSKFPVVLTRSHSEGPGERLKALKEHLRKIPNRGIGYGILRYLTPDTGLKAESQDQVQPELTFNYLGQFDQTLHESGLFTWSSVSPGPIRSLRAHRSTLVEIIGMINAGALQLEWSYSENIHRRATIEALANEYMAALRALILHCQSPEAGGYTPSDFPLARISQRELDEILSHLPTEGGQPELTDLYPLTPLQQGIWFHELAARESGVYFRRIVSRLQGEIDVDLLRQAWEAVVVRHEVLRTSLVWQGLEQPLQIVHPSVVLPWERQDWRDSPATEEPDRLKAFLEQDRTRGLDFTEAPLMRLTLIQVAERKAILIWTYHHLILDRWSIEIVQEDLWSTYQALRNGQAAPDRRPRPFREYLDWLQKQDLAEAERHWRRTLKGFQATTMLGVERESVPGERRTDQFDDQQLTLSERATGSLERFARQHQVTLNTLVQGAWAFVLSRYSETQDVAFGVTSSGRLAELRGMETMVGMFINTLPVRVMVDDSRPVAAWLKEVQAQQAGMRQYEYTPLFEVQKWSEVPAGAPLFNSLIVFENTPGGEVFATEAGGLSVRQDFLTSDLKTNYPLNLACVADRTLHMLITYDTERFGSAAIRRLLGHLQQVLAEMVAKPDQPLGAISWVTEAERCQLLVDWNATTTDTLSDACFLDLFAARVAGHPDAAALVFEDQALTYAELNKQANQLARYLHRKQLRSEDCVGIYLPRGVDLVVAILGVWKAGGAYVPLDPAYPMDRIAYMLKDSGARLLLTHTDMATLLPGQDSSIVFLDAIKTQLKSAAGTNPGLEINPDALAYVLYTSGSTGTPKGVLVPHRGLSNVGAEQQRHFGVGSQSRVLQFASSSFDASVFELVMALQSGGALHLGSPDSLQPGDPLLRLLREHAITIATLPPSALAAMAPEPLPALVTLTVAGEACPPAVIEQWGVGRTFFNLYGPTEGTIWATVAQCQAGSPGRPPIGTPIGNTQVYLLDPGFQPVPIGIPGELYIGGVGVTRGYMGRPDVTAQSFVPHPFSSEPGARLYRTGDRARYREDGSLDFLGRIDYQVKLRGYRIELGEIETALGRHPRVAECVVLVREDEPGSKRLVAYVVPAEEPQSPGDLRQYLKQTLPEYMVPAIFMKLDALPLSPNGKVDRRALPVPESSQLQVETDFVAPRSTYEEAVAEIWRDALGLDQVGVNDNFFDLGGHSLMATRIVSRLKTTFDVDVPLRAFFDTPTIAGVSATLATARRGEDPGEKARLLPVARNDALPLSFAQERFWVLDQFHADRTVYNGPAGFRLKGGFRLDVFEKSVQALVDRHEVLRTTFASAEGGPHQVIAPALSVQVPLRDCSGLPGDEQAGMIQQVFLEERCFEFDLAQGPLFRTRLLRFAEDDHFLVLNLHHIIHDAWSLEVIINDLVTAYTAGCAGQAIILPDLPIQYVDYAQWQRELSEGRVGRRQLAFWKSQLADLPPALPLPTDYARPSVQTFRGARENLRLPADLTAPLRALNRQEGTTLFMVMLATLQFHLHRLTGTTDIIVGSPVAGRDQQELHGLIGCFLNTLALRTDLSGNLTGRDLLKRVREVVLNAYENQDVPFEKLLAEVRPARDPSRTPIFQVVLNMHSFDDRDFPLPGLSVTRARSAQHYSLFDMTLYFQECTDEILLGLVYNADLFTAGRMTEFLRQFQSIIAQMITDPDRPLEAFTLVTPSARSTLPDPQQPLDAEWEGPVWSRLEHHARQRGEAIAMVSPGATWTYRDLEARSNRLAHRLLEQGIKVQDVVAIHAARSPELVLALLGILKAGAAFMILDSSYPSRRLLEMLRIARPRGFVHLEETGSLPDEIEAWAAGVPCRVRLPAFAIDDTDPGESWGSAAQTAPEVTVQPDDKAYITFTSGSSGMPKCLQGTHRPLSHFIRWYTQTLQLTAADRITLFSGLAHDPLLRDVFTPLWLGGTLCIPDSEALALGRVGDWMNEQKISLMHLTPPLVDLLTVGHETPRYPCLSLRYAVFGGESLRPVHLDCTKQLAPQATCVNGYGATETPQIMCWYEVPAEFPSNGEQVPIGQGIDGVQILVLSKNRQLAGIGELGELYIRTPYLTLGYVNDEELTSARFLPNAFRSEARDRMYRTGDLGRYRPDGTVEFVRRDDDQVKIRGYRVELGEVETALAQHPLIQKAAVVRRDDGPAGPYLAGYLQIDQNDAVPPEALRSFLRERLPEYMVPSAWVVLDAFPLTPNGKIDRKALPSPDVTRENLDVAFVAPRTPIEVAIAAIWQEVLKLDRVGIHDNFFDLGGHSLLATQVVARVKESLHIDLKLRYFFAVPTLKELAGTVEILQHSTETPESLKYDTGEDRSEILL